MAAGIYTVSPRTLLGYRVLAATVLPVLVLLVGSFKGLSIALALLSIALGWMLPLVVVRRRARLRLVQIDRALPDLVDLLVVTVEAGLGFSGSLRVAADQFAGPLGDELRLTLQEHAMGLSMSDALLHCWLRRYAQHALVRARRGPGREPRRIDRHDHVNVAVDMRKRRRAVAEERSRKAPVKLIFPLVFLIFPSMFIVLLLPAAFSISTSSPDAEANWRTRSS